MLVIFFLFVSFSLLGFNAFLEEATKAFLEKTCDYDSKTYLALAREKEAKRRARFEATKLRLMEDDIQLAFAGSKLGLNLIRLGIHGLTYFIDPQSGIGKILFANSFSGNIGIAFFVGWAGTKAYKRAREYWSRFSFAKPQEQKPEEPATRYLSDNCQKKPKSYTKTHRIILSRYKKLYRSPYNGNTNHLSRNIGQNNGVV